MHPSKERGADGSTAKDDGATLEFGSNHHQNQREASNQLKFMTGVTLKLTMMFVVLGITCLLLNQPSYHTQLLRNSDSFLGPRYSPSCENSNTSSSSSFHQYTSQIPPFFVNEETIELEKTLRAAAMKDKKTVIITTVNAKWMENNSIFDLFLESFRVGNGTAELLNHVVVAGFDETAYKRCTAKGLHCYAVMTEGVDFSGEAFYMSEDYVKMMWRRIDFLRTVLELGFDFVFTDADIMWFRNPFERFYPDGEFQIASDWFTANYTDRHNHPNAGFKYVKASNGTIEFYKYWYAGRLYFPGNGNQGVLNRIKFNPFIAEIGLQMMFLDTAEFGGFCESGNNMDRTVTIHANCCTGIAGKMHALKNVVDDWKRYIALSAADRTNVTATSWTVPRKCG